MPLVHGPHWEHQGCWVITQVLTYPRRLTLAQERSGGTSQSRIIQDTSFHFVQLPGRGQGEEAVSPLLEEPEAPRVQGLPTPSSAWPVFFPLLPKCLWEVGHSPLGNLFFLGSEGPHLQQASPILDGPTIP